MRKLFFVAALVFLMVSCQNYPKDPEGTLKKISNDTLRVGYSETPPWVIETELGTSGIEVTLVKEFAAQHQAKIKWVKNSENELFQELIDRKLDIVITGLTTDSPWKKEKIGVTRPYLKMADRDHIMAVPQGENAFLISLENFLLGRENKIMEMRKAYEKNPAL